jgi:hypothetical protein
MRAFFEREIKRHNKRKTKLNKRADELKKITKQLLDVHQTQKQNELRQKHIECDRLRIHLENASARYKKKQKEYSQHPTSALMVPHAQHHYHHNIAPLSCFEWLTPTSCLSLSFLWLSSDDPTELIKRDIAMSCKISSQPVLLLNGHIPQYRSQKSHFIFSFFVIIFEFSWIMANI